MEEALRMVLQCSVSKREMSYKRFVKMELGCLAGKHCSLAKTVSGKAFYDAIDKLGLINIYAPT